MKFVLVEEDVVSVELSLNAIRKIANGLAANSDGTDSEVALANAFNTAYENFSKTDGDSQEVVESVSDSE